MNKREKQKAETLADIMNAAQTLFSRQGYEKTSIQQIADMCGITKGALYHHFSSKEEVLEKMCMDHYEQLLEATSGIPGDRSLSAFEKMEKIIRTMRTIGMEKASFVTEYLKVRHDEGSIILNERLGKYDRKFYIKVVAPVLSEARERGECSFPSSPEVISGFIYSLDRGVTREINNIFSLHSGSEAEKLIRDLLEGFVHALSSMLIVEQDIIRKMIGIEEAYRFFHQIIGEDKQK